MVQVFMDVVFYSVVWWSTYGDTCLT